MIRLASAALPPAADIGLRRYQRAIDAIGDYAERVEKAKRDFSARNKADNLVFREVRRILSEMCAGARRCCYCEDSVADEVEHIQPKDLYPELVFVWENYLYACGPCNGPKNNKFAVIDGADGLLIVTRRHNAPPVPPVRGEPALINPRSEDPLAYLDLDIVDSFYFLVAEGLRPKDQKRAEYTLELLALNDRDVLVESRRTAYGSYRARLYEYVDKKEKGHDQKELGALSAGIRAMPHPTVWAEMKRRHVVVPELKPLFLAAPEALTW